MGRNCSQGAISPLLHNILQPDLKFLCKKTPTRFSLRDKRLFEITEVEITRVDCIIYTIMMYGDTYVYVLLT